MDKQQIEIALAAGLALTDPNTDLLEVFRKHAMGVQLLRQLLIQIGSGQIALSATTVEDPTGAPPDATPPAAIPNKGPAFKKGEKKKVSKKNRKPQLKKK